MASAGELLAIEGLRITVLGIEVVPANRILSRYERPEACFEERYVAAAKPSIAIIWHDKILRYSHYISRATLTVCYHRVASDALQGDDGELTRSDTAGWTSARPPAFEHVT
jgi:hypothetical protein